MKLELKVKKGMNIYKRDVFKLETQAFQAKLELKIKLFRPSKRLNFELEHITFVNIHSFFYFDFSLHPNFTLLLAHTAVNRAVDKRQQDRF